MTRNHSRNVQEAINFLSRLNVLADAHWARLPASQDYDAILALAHRHGFETDEAAIREAFALIMRARLIASLDRTGACQVN